jgi:hypothetical protein
MTLEQKRQVREALMRYTANFDTQAEAAAGLDAVSSSTISLIRNNNWELLSDRLWHHVARQVGFYCREWQAADTSAHMLLRILFSDAQHYAMAYAIAMSAGLGKSFTLAHYAKTNENVICISGKDTHNRRSFLQTMLQSLGEAPETSTKEMMKQLVAAICAKDQPLVVIDDAQHLKDRVLLLLALIAAELSEKAGIVIMGDATLRMRIIEGVRMKRAGFAEIYKIIGRRFITLNSISDADTEAVCRANGVHDEDVIACIAADSNNLHAVTSHIVQHLDRRIAA